MAGFKEIMAQTNHPNRKVVLGLGNLLFSDEGFGIQAVQTLQAEHGSQFPVEWIDGGVLGLNLLPLVEECSHLLVLDAVDAEQSAGTLLELADEDIPLYNGVKMSEHQVGFQEVLGMAKFRERFPAHLYMVGVQPADLSVRVGLSPEVTAALPAVLERATDILREWFPD
jgi:hydrogenase maturation protease